MSAAIGPTRHVPRVAFVSSHGGHLSELILLKEAIEGIESFQITYASERTQGMPNTYLLANIGTSPVRMIVSVFQIANILAREKPDAIISTGAEIALPVFLLGRAMGMKLIFVESLTRVRKPSGTGLLVYPLANLFIVQWPDLLKRYGNRAEFVGSLL